MPVAEQGVSLDRYMLIPRVLVFLRRGEKVLLIKGAPEKRLWAGLYNGVGGHVEPGESIRNAAHRELLEETGARGELWLCGTVVVDTGRNPGVCLFVFSGECMGEPAATSAEGSLHWVNPTEIGSLPSVADLPDLIKRIWVHRAGSPPFSARSFYDMQGKLQMVFDE